jgi:hypothetical protein
MAALQERQGVCVVIAASTTAKSAVYMHAALGQINHTYTGVHAGCIADSYCYSTVALRYTGIQSQVLTVADCLCYTHFAVMCLSIHLSAHNTGAWTTAAGAGTTLTCTHPWAAT